MQILAWVQSISLVGNLICATEPCKKPLQSSEYYIHFSRMSVWCLQDKQILQFNRFRFAFCKTSFPVNKWSLKLLYLELSIGKPHSTDVNKILYGFELITGFSLLCFGKFWSNFKPCASKGSLSFKIYLLCDVWFLVNYQINLLPHVGTLCWKCTLSACPHHEKYGWTHCSALKIVGTARG